jgi:hypothetical protein
MDPRQRGVPVGAVTREHGVPALSGRRGAHGAGPEYKPSRTPGATTLRAVYQALIRTNVSSGTVHVSGVAGHGNKCTFVRATASLPSTRWIRAPRAPSSLPGPPVRPRTSMMPRARATGSPGDDHPVSPTMSGVAGRCPTTGVSHAIASPTTFGKLSESGERKRRCTVCRACGRS